MNTIRAYEMIQMPPPPATPEGLPRPVIRHEPRHDFLLALFPGFAPSATGFREQPTRDRRRKFRTGDLP